MAMEDIRSTGYSREEEYFYKRNQELIEKRRRELDAQRREQESAAARGDYWMRCPKCGGQMEEEDLAHIKVERCTQCKGLYFDHGELETLLEAQEPAGFLGGLRRLFR